MKVIGSIKTILHFSVTFIYRPWESWSLHFPTPWQVRTSCKTWPVRLCNSGWSCSTPQPCQSQLELPVGSFRVASLDIRCWQWCPRWGHAVGKNTSIYKKDKKYLAWGSFLTTTYWSALVNEFPFMDHRPWSDNPVQLGIDYHSNVIRVGAQSHFVKVF